MTLLHILPHLSVEFGCVLAACLGHMLALVPKRIECGCYVVTVPKSTGTAWKGTNNDTLSFTSEFYEMKPLGLLHVFINFLPLSLANSKY